MNSRGPSEVESSPENVRHAPRGLQDVEEHLDRGRLARAGGAEKGIDAAFGDREREIGDGVGFPEAALEALSFDDVIHFRFRFKKDGPSAV